MISKMSDCVYVCISDKKNQSVLLQSSNIFSNKEYFQSDRPQCALIESTTWRSTYHCFSTKTISHMLFIHMKSLFRSEKKGMNRLHNMSESSE